MRSKEPLPGDLAVCIAISALAAVSFLITPSSLHWLARPVVFFALFSLLCYSLLAVVFPRQGDLLPQARAGLSAAAGLGGAILAALSSGLLREWHLLALAVLLGLLTIASAVYARQLRISLPRRKRYTLATRQGFTPIRPGGVVRRRSPLQRHLPALAIVVLALALTFALGYFALPDRGPGITRLNILGDDNRPDVYSGSVVAGQINPAGSSPASSAGAASAAAAPDGSNLSDNRSDVEVLAGGQSPNSTNNSTNNQTGVSGRAAIPQRRPAFGGGGGSTASTTSTTTSTQARAIEPDPSRLAAIENLELDEEEPEVDDEVEDLEAAEEVEVAEEEPLSIEDNQSQAASVGNDSPAVSPQAPASAPAPSPAGLDGAREVNVSPAGAGAAGLTEAEVPDDQRPAGGDVNQPPIVTDLRPDLASPQRAGPKVTWTARASDPEDPILYRFYLNGLPVTGWSSSQNWTWPTSGWKPGEYRVKVWVRDGTQAPEDEKDSAMHTPFLLSAQPQPQQP
ncbi:MAG: DUF1616 domain-containing protein, partial [Methanosarcinales archaeon]|nr:DUF1616 domain-containing protein [Methanosarcinales archaeon]